VRVREAAAAAGEEPARLALNLQSAVAELLPLDARRSAPSPAPVRARGRADLAPLLLSLALPWRLADLVIGYALRGLLPRFRRSACRGGPSRASCGDPAAPARRTRAG
jgi:hypothetical protein